MAQAFNLTAQLNLRGPTNVRTIVADIRRQLGTIRADVNLRINPNTNRNIAQLSRTLQNFNTALRTTQTAANDAATAISNLSSAINGASLQNVPRNIANVGAATQRLAQNAANTSQQVRQARTEMEEFGRQSALAVRRFAAFTTVTSGIFALTNAIRQGLSEFIAFDKEMIKLQQVTGESANGLKNLSNTITSLSSNLGVSSSDLVQVSATLAQAGLSARDTERALRALALSSLAPSFDNMNSTVEGSIALMRQFGIGAKDLESALGSVNSVAAAFAVESGDIIAAIQRTGGVFAAASRGVSEGKDALNEFISVFTSVRATTRESAETIATGLRTIFTRIQRGGTIEALKQFGVNLTDAEGKFVGAYKAVELLSRGLNQIDPRDLRFSQIVEELGGFRQIGKVIPLIQQFSTAQQALKVAQEGQGSLAADAVKAQLSLANQISKVREEFLALVRDIGGSETFQNLAKGALSLASGLIQVADGVKGVLPALTALMAIRGTSAALQFGAGFMGGIRRSGGARGLGNRIGGGTPFASGGYVPGTGNRDTVPAMLTPGEFVIRKKAVEKIGVKRLAHINRYATGGPVMASRLKSSEVRKRVKSANSNINEEEFRKGNYLTDSDSIIFDKYEYGVKSSKNIGWSAFEKQVGKKIGGKPVGGNAPIDIPINKKRMPIEVRNRNQTTKDPELLDKLLRYKISRGQPLISNKKTKDNNLYAGKMGVAYNTGKIQRDRFKELSGGGEVQRFMAGQAVKPAKTQTLSPQNLVIGPGYLQKGEWTSTLKSLISKNGLESDPDSRNLIIAGQKIALSDAFSARQLASSKLKQQVGLENIIKLEKLRADVASAYSGKRAGVVEENRPRTENEVKVAQEKNLLFGAAGMYGRRFPASKVVLGEADGLKSQIEVAVFGALLDKNTAEREARLKKRNIMLQGAGIKENQDSETNEIKSAPTSQGLSKFFGYKASVSGVSRANKKLAIDTVNNIAQSLSPGNGGSQIFLDFDRTLAFGSDKIGPKIDKKKPDYSAFGDNKQVVAGLGKAKLSGLGLRLRSLVSELDTKSPGLGKELLRRMFVVSARPAKTMPLIARWLRNQGLRIPPSNVTGVGGAGVGPSGVAVAKAEKIAKMSGPGSVFIDDDSKNIQAARDKNINSIQYGSAITKKAKKQAAQQEGLQFEQFISDQLPASLKTGIFGTDGEGIDFPFGLGQKIADYWFKDSRLASIPVDTKRTLTGPRGKIKKNIISYLRGKGYSGGGEVENYYGKTEVEAARKAWNKLKSTVKRAWSAENTYFEVGSPKSIAPGTEAEVYGTGIGKLAKGEPGVVGSKKIKLAKEKAVKSSDPREAAKRKAVRKQDQLAAMALKGILGGLPEDKQKELAGLFGLRPGSGPGLMPSMGSGGADAAKELAEAKKQVSAFKKTGSLNVSKRFLDFFRSSIASYYLELKQASMSDPSDPDLKKQLKRTRRAGVDIKKSVRTQEPIGVQGRRTAAGETMNLMLKERFQGFSRGGSVEDKVPAMLTPGEFVINRRAAKQIGASRLHQLNRADRIKGFNKGGPVGFVQRFESGGFAQLVRQFKSAGDDIVTAARKAREQISRDSGTGSQGIRNRSAARAQEVAENRLNRRRAAKGLATTAPVVPAPRTKQEYVAERRAAMRTVTSDDPASAMSMRAVNRASNRAGVSLRRTGVNPDGTPQFTTQDWSQKTGRTNVDIARLQRRSAGRSASLESMTPNQVRLAMQSRQLAATRGQGPVGSFRDFSNKADATNRNIQATRDTANRVLGNTTLSPAGRAYLQQLNSMQTPLQKLAAGFQNLRTAFSSTQNTMQTLQGAAKAVGSAITSAGKGVTGFASQIGSRLFGRSTQVPGGPPGGGPPNRGLGSGSASMRAQARQLRSQGLRGQDLRDSMTRQSAGQRLGNAAFGLSFALPMIMDQFKTENPRTEQQASNNAFNSGVGSALGSGIMMASMGGPLGIAAGIVTGAAGLGKAFVDAKNAAIEFSKNKAKEKMEESSEKVASILEEISKKGGSTPEALSNLNKELKNTIVSANEAGSMSKRSSMIQDFGISGMLSSTLGLFGIDSAAEGSTDGGSKQGAINRSMILDQKGIFAYLKSTQDKNFELNAMSEIAPQLAKESSKTFSVAADAVNSVLKKKFETGASLSDILKNPEWEDQANVIARSNAEINRQIMLIETDTRLTEDEIKARRGAIIAAYAESKAREQFKLVEIEKNMRLLEDSVKSATFSFNRMLQNMDAAVLATADNLKLMNDQIDLVSASLSGQAKIGKASGIEKTINVLKNPRGYDPKERNAAASMGASLFGGQGSNVQKIITASSKIEDTLLAAINESGANTDKKLTNEAVGARLENAVRSKLTQLGLPPELADKLGKQINSKIGELRKDGEDKIDFAELVEKIPGLSGSIDILKKTNEGVISALEGLKNTFDAYSEASDRIVELQLSINDKLRSAQTILSKGSQTLANALGRRVPMGQQLEAVNQPIRAMTGGTTDPTQIRANINRLENNRNQLEAGRVQAQNKTDLQGVQDFNQKLIRNNIALRENYQALEALANSGEKASIALDEMNRIQQKQQAGTGLVERLATSSPSELNSLQGAMFRLERNMRGQANFGSSSDMRKESLDLFNQIAPLLGDRQGALKANVLESQLAEAGVQETPFIRSVLEALRNPESDPEMKAATDAYRSATIEQARANVQLALLNNTLATNIATQSAEAIKKAITDTRVKFDDQQLKDLLNGINNIPQGKPAAGLASGGVVYRSGGGEMFVPRGTDTVPAMLTPGEFVVNKNATSRNLPLLKSINKGTSYYASGGVVSTNFINDTSVKDDLRQARVTDKSYKIISSEAYGPKNPVSYIAGYQASIVPAKSSQSNPMKDLMEQYILGKNVGGAEEKTDKLANKTLDLRPEKVELGFGSTIMSSPGTEGGWFDGGEFRPIWSKDALSPPAVNPSSLTGKNPIILPTDYINIPNKSLWASERPLFERLRDKVDNTNYDDQKPTHASISAQEAIADHIKSSLESLDLAILSDKIASSRDIKYPDKDWFSTRLVKATSGTLGASPANYSTSHMVPDKYMNVQVVSAGSKPVPLTNRKSSHPILTSVKGNYGSIFGMTKIRGDIGYDNDTIYGETTETSKLLSQEKLDQFTKTKEIYIQELDDYLKQLKDADKGSFVDSGATQTAWSAMTLLDQIFNDNLSGLYVTIPSDRLTEEWKNKGKSINIFRRSVLGDWAANLKDLKDTTSAKIYGVNDPSELKINDTIFPWVGSSDDPDLLSNIVSRFTQQQLEAKQNFVSQFNLGPPNMEKDISSNLNGIKFGFSYSALKIPRLSSGTGFNKPTDPRNMLEGIILNPSNEPEPDMLNPFMEETPDKVSRRFVEGKDAVAKIKQQLRKNIQIARQAVDKNTPIGPTGIPDLLKLLPVPKTQTSSWIGDDFDKAFYLSGPANPINLYDQLIKLKESIQQQKLERAAAAGETAKVAGADISSDLSKSITKNSVPLSQQILSGVLGPKGNILSNYGHRLFPIKIFQDIVAMSNYLGGVSKVFGRQIVKPLNKKTDPKLPPQQQQFKVEPKLAEAWGAVEASKELFNDIANQSYLKLGNFISVSGGTPTINTAKLQEYAIRKGQQGAAYLNVQGSLDTAFNDQNQKEVSKIVDPKKGAIEQAVLDAKTGALSYKQADVPTNLIELGNLALGPYNIMPATKRSALLDKLKEELQKANAETLVAEITRMKQWYQFQDSFINSGSTSIDQFMRDSSSRRFIDVLKDYQTYAASLELLTPNSLGVLPDKQKLEEMAAFRSQKQKAAEPQKAAKGGVIYAQTGTLVNYQPKGTDTVPAMLTPGEFVVNRAATQKNLPLLKSINSGQYNKGGKVGYLSTGGIIMPKYYADPAGQVSGPNSVVGVSNLQMSLDSTSLDGLKTFNSDFGTNIASLTAFGTVFGQNISAISTLTTQLASVAAVLYKLSIPEQINISAQHKVEVIINGAQAFNNMQEGVKDLVVSSVNTAVSKLNVSTDNAFGEGSNKILGKMA